MSLKPYPEYKDSGIEWLGDVPVGWEVARLKNSIEVARNGVWGSDPDGSDLDLRCVRVADFDRPRQSIHDNNSTLRNVTLDDRKGRILQEGNLLLEKSGGGEKSPVGFVVLYDRPEPAVCSNFVARLIIRSGMDSRFWTYVHSLFYSLRLTQRSIKQATGIQNLDQASYFNERVALPSDAEQEAIADYLDRETTEIDAFIADQFELIALLNERRTATITHAVTKGLDPEATMKESGIEWLGQVPRHWSIRGIKAAAATYGGSGFPHEYQGIRTEELPFHKVSALAGAGPDGVIRDSRDTVSRTTAKILGAKVFPAGTIVMAKIGAALLLGRMRSVDRPFCIDNNMLALVPNEGYVTKYLIYALQIVSFDLIVNPGAVPSLDMVAFRNYPLAFPSEQEQQAVADFLDHEMAEIDATIAEAREAIALSRERRAAVISAAVTGKIDVRGLTAPAATEMECDSVVLGA